MYYIEMKNLISIKKFTTGCSMDWNEFPIYEGGLVLEDLFDQIKYYQGRKILFFLNKKNMKKLLYFIISYLVLISYLACSIILD